MAAPRSIWNGTISFGLAHVPIKLYSATQSKTVHFHEVHMTDGARIEHGLAHPPAAPLRPLAVRRQDERLREVDPLVVGRRRPEAAAATTAATTAATAVPGSDPARRVGDCHGGQRRRGG